MTKTSYRKQQGKVTNHTAGHTNIYHIMSMLLLTAHVTDV